MLSLNSLKYWHICPMHMKNQENKQREEGVGREEQGEEKGDQKREREKEEEEDGN